MMQPPERNSAATTTFHALIAMAVRLGRESGTPGDDMPDVLLNHAFEARAHGVDLPGRIDVAERLVRASSRILAIYRQIAKDQGLEC